MLNLAFSRPSATDARLSVRVREINRLWAFADRMAALAAVLPGPPTEKYVP